MRFISLLTMTVAAIFFAVSVFADARANYTDGGATQCAQYLPLGGKVYKVCKSWREDQGGPMPTEEMEHCRNTLCYEACVDGGDGCEDKGWGGGADRVNGAARQRTKDILGYW